MYGYIEPSPAALEPLEHYFHILLDNQVHFNGPISLAKAIETAKSLSEKGRSRVFRNITNELVYDSGWSL